MSHTDKDMPYDVRALNNALIRHNHTNGLCVTGTWAQAKVIMKQRNAHRANCPREVYKTECIHDGERIRYQNAVDAARASQKGFGLLYASAMPRGFYERASAPVVPVRSKSSEAITAMMDAGYLPNCGHDKTHTVDVREVNLGLLAGERVGVYYKERNHYGTPAIMLARYDAQIACSFCDENPYVTCYIQERSTYGRRDRCSCCRDHYNHRESRRSTARDDAKSMLKEYNTYGDLAD